MNERPWPLPSVAFRLSRTCFDLNRITAGFTGFYWVSFFLNKRCSMWRPNLGTESSLSKYLLSVAAGVVFPSLYVDTWRFEAGFRFPQVYRVFLLILRLCIHFIPFPRNQTILPYRRWQCFFFFFFFVPHFFCLSAAFRLSLSLISVAFCYPFVLFCYVVFGPVSIRVAIRFASADGDKRATARRTWRVWPSKGIVSLMARVIRARSGPYRPDPTGLLITRPPFPSRLAPETR